MEKYKKYLIWLFVWTIFLLGTILGATATTTELKHINMTNSSEIMTGHTAYGWTLVTASGYAWYSAGASYDKVLFPIWNLSRSNETAYFQMNGHDPTMACGLTPDYNLNNWRNYAYKFHLVWDNTIKIVENNDDGTNVFAIDTGYDWDADGDVTYCFKIVVHPTKGANYYHKTCTANEPITDTGWTATYDSTPSGNDNGRIRDQAENYSYHLMPSAFSYNYATWQTRFYQYLYVIDTPFAIDDTSYNMTSATQNATQWRTDKTFSVPTTDPTPSVVFELTQTGNCSIGLTDKNYTAMIADDADTACATTDATSQTCTLPSSQALSSGAQDIYIACVDTAGVVFDSSEALNATYNPAPQVTSIKLFDDDLNEETNLSDVLGEINDNLLLQAFNLSHEENSTTNLTFLVVHGTNGSVFLNETVTGINTSLAVNQNSSVFIVNDYVAYNITITALDANGRSTSSTSQFTIKNQLPNITTTDTDLSACSVVDLCRIEMTVVDDVNSDHTMNVTCFSPDELTSFTDSSMTHVSDGLYQSNQNVFSKAGEWSCNGWTKDSQNALKEKNFTVVIDVVNNPTGGSSSGSSDVDLNKRVCDILIAPKNIVLTRVGKLVEVQLSNNDVLTYDPTFEFRSVGDTDMTSYLFLSNQVLSLLPEEKRSFGVKFDPKIDVVEMNGSAELVISNDICADFVIPISIKIGSTENFFDSYKGKFSLLGLFNLEGVVGLAKESIFSSDSLLRDTLPLLNFGLLFLVCLLGYLLVFFNQLKNTWAEGRIGMFIAWLVFLLVVTILTAVFVINAVRVVW